MPRNKVEREEVDGLKAEVAALRSELATVRQEHDGIVVAVAQFQTQLKEAIDLARQTLTRTVAFTENVVRPEGEDATEASFDSRLAAYRAAAAAVARCEGKEPAEALADMCIRLSENGTDAKTRLSALLLVRAIQGGMSAGEFLEADCLADVVARYANRRANPRPKSE